MAPRSDELERRTESDEDPIVRILAGDEQDDIAQILGTPAPPATPQEPEKKPGILRRLLGGPTVLGVPIRAGAAAAREVGRAVTERPLAPGLPAPAAITRGLERGREVEALVEQIGEAERGELTIPAERIVTPTEIADYIRRSDDPQAAEVLPDSVAIAERVNRGRLGLDDSIAPELLGNIEASVAVAELQERINRYNTAEQDRDAYRRGQLRSIEAIAGTVGGEAAREAVRLVAAKGLPLTRDEAAGAIAAGAAAVPPALTHLAQSVSGIFGKAIFPAISHVTGIDLPEFGIEPWRTAQAENIDNDPDMQRRVEALRGLSPAQRAAQAIAFATPGVGTMEEVVRYTRSPAYQNMPIEDLADLATFNATENERWTRALEITAAENTDKGIGNAMERLANVRVLDMTLADLGWFVWGMRAFKAAGHRIRGVNVPPVRLTRAEIAALRGAGMSRREIGMLQARGVSSEAEALTLRRAGLSSRRVAQSIQYGATSLPYSLTDELLDETAGIAAIGALQAVDDDAGVPGVIAAVATAAPMVGMFRTAAVPFRLAGRVTSPVVRGANRFLGATGRATVNAWGDIMNRMPSSSRRGWNLILDKIATDYVHVERFKDGQRLSEGAERARARYESELEWNPFTGKLSRTPKRRYQNLVAPLETGEVAVLTERGKGSQATVSFQRSMEAMVLNNETGQLERRTVNVDQRPDLGDKLRATRDVADQLNLPVTSIIESTGRWEGATEPSLLLTFARRLTDNERTALAERFLGLEFANQQVVPMWEPDPAGHSMLTRVHFRGGITTEMQSGITEILNRHGFSGATFTPKTVEVMHSLWQDSSGKDVTLGEQGARWMRAVADIKRRFNLKSNDFERLAVRSSELRLENVDLTTVQRGPTGIVSAEYDIPNGWRDPAVAGAPVKPYRLARVYENKATGTWTADFYDDGKSVVDSKTFQNLTSAMEDVRSGGGTTIRRLPAEEPPVAPAAKVPKTETIESIEGKTETPINVDASTAVARITSARDVGIPGPQLELTRDPQVGFAPGRDHAWITPDGSYLVRSGLSDHEFEAARMMGVDPRDEAALDALAREMYGGRSVPDIARDRKRALVRSLTKNTSILRWNRNRASAGLDFWNELTDAQVVAITDLAVRVRDLDLRLERSYEVGGVLDSEGVRLGRDASHPLFQDITERNIRRVVRDMFKPIEERLDIPYLAENNLRLIKNMRDAGKIGEEQYNEWQDKLVGNRVEDGHFDRGIDIKSTVAPMLMAYVLAHELENGAWGEDKKQWGKVLHYAALAMGVLGIGRATYHYFRSGGDARLALEALLGPVKTDGKLYMDFMGALGRRVEDAARLLPETERLAELALKGKATRKWYRTAWKELKNTFGPDARLMAALLAVTSPRRTVDLNMKQALMAYEIIRGGRFTNQQQMLYALREAIPFTAEIHWRHVMNGDFEAIGRKPNQAELRRLTRVPYEKIAAFYLNLTGRYEPVVNDVWMSQIFGLMVRKKDSSTGKLTWEQHINKTNNAFVAEVVSRVAEHLGWGNDEAQAAMWAVTKEMVEKRGYEPVLSPNGATPALIARNVRALLDFIETQADVRRTVTFTDAMRRFDVKSAEDALVFGRDEATISALRRADSYLKQTKDDVGAIDHFIRIMQYAISTGLITSAERLRAMDHLLGEYRYQAEMLPNERVEAIQHADRHLSDIEKTTEREWARRVPFDKMLPGLAFIPLSQSEDKEQAQAGLQLPTAIVIGVAGALGARMVVRGLRRLRGVHEAGPLANRYELVTNLADALRVPRDKAIEFAGGRKRVTAISPAEERVYARDIRQASELAAQSIGELVYEGKPPENLASLVEGYIKDPASMAKERPADVLKLRDDLTDEYPHILEALDKASNDYRMLRDDPTLAKLKDRLVEPSMGRLDIRQLGLRLYTSMVNNLEPLAEMARDLTGQSRPSLELYTEFWARMSRAAPRRAFVMLERGVPDYKTGRIRDDVKPLKQIVDEIGYRRLDQFEYWAVANRALELYRLREQRGLPAERQVGLAELAARGDEALAAELAAEGETSIAEEIKMIDLSREEAQRISEQFDSPEFRKHFEDLRTFQVAMLEFLRDSGVITTDNLRSMVEQQPFYVPLFRWLDDGKGGGPKIRGSYEHIFAPIKRIKGTSARNLKGIWSGIGINAFAFSEVVARHEVTRSLFNLAQYDQDGTWIKRIKPVARPTQFKGREIAPALEEAGVPREYRALFGDETLAVWRPSAMTGRPNTISMIDPATGTRVYAEVDPTIGQTLHHLGAAQSLFAGIFGTVARAMTSTYRATATTLSPEFLVRNPARDVIHAFVVSNYGFNPMTDFVRGVYHLFNKDDMYWHWLSSGGGLATLMSVDRKTLRNEFLAALTKDPRFTEDQIATVSISRRDKQPVLVNLNPLHWLRVASDALEHATRLGAFARAVTGRGPRTEGRGTIPEEVTKKRLFLGAEESREVSLDFSRVGVTGEAVRQLVAFWNPAVQGWAKFFNVHRQNPKRTAARAIAAITVPSVLNWLVNHEDEDWKRRPNWERNLFWLWKMPNGRWLRVPKPFEFGVIYGSLVERSLDWLWDRDTKGMREITDTIVNNFTSQLLGLSFDIAGRRDADVGGVGLTGGLVPNFAKPMLEASINWDFFRESRIVSDKDAKLSNRYQYNAAYVSEWARQLGGVLNISPAKIEHVVYGHVPGLGRLFGWGMDEFLSTVGQSETGEQPSDFPWDLPLVRGFVGRQTSLSAPSVQDFYTTLDRARRTKADMDRLINIGRAEELEAHIGDMEFNLAVLPFLEQANESISDLRDEVSSIRYDPDLSGAEKTQQMQPLLNEIILIAEETLREIDALKAGEQNPGEVTPARDAEPPAPETEDDEIGRILGG